MSWATPCVSARSALAGQSPWPATRREIWWKSDIGSHGSDYQEGLAFAQLSPGPLAAQLAMYIGWLRGGVMGTTLVGIAFTLPSFLMALVLAAVYVHFGSLPWIQGMFYGIGAAVIAII